MILNDFDEAQDPQLLQELLGYLGREQFKPGLERIRRSFTDQQYQHLNNLFIITIAEQNRQEKKGLQVRLKS